MSQSSAARELIETPKPGTWTLDSSHSSVGFVARHLMFAKVRGSFDRYEVDVTVADRVEDSSVAVAIDASSIDTNDPRRDEHLRSPDFLDVQNYPQLTYRSTAVEQTGPTSLRIDGDLTIRGVTKPVALDATFEGLVGDPWGNEHAIFTATAEIDREEFGLTWNQALESGGVLVGKVVKIEIEVELVPKA